jgi:hypothetical protein
MYDLLQIGRIVDMNVTVGKEELRMEGLGKVRLGNVRVEGWKN